MYIDSKKSHYYTNKLYSLGFTNEDIKKIDSIFNIKCNKSTFDDLINNFKLLYSDCILDCATGKSGLVKNFTNTDFNFFDDLDSSFKVYFDQVFSDFDFQPLLSILEFFKFHTLSIDLDELYNGDDPIEVILPNSVNHLVFNSNVMFSKINFYAGDRALDTVTFDFSGLDFYGAYKVDTNFYFKHLNIVNYEDLTVANSQFLKSVSIKKCEGYLDFISGVLNLESIEIIDSEINFIVFNEDKYFLNRDNLLELSVYGIPDEDHVVIKNRTFEIAEFLLAKELDKIQNVISECQVIDGPHGDFRFLLPGTNYVHIGFDSEDDIFQKKHSLYLQNKFPGVESLSLCGVGGLDEGVSLPVTVKNICIGVSDFSLLEGLNLEKLEMHYGYNEDLKNVPDNLRLLSIRNYEDLDFSFVKPLDFLKIQFFDQSELKNIVDLPDDLKILEVVNCVTLENIQYFPESLEKIKIVDGNLASLPSFAPNMTELHLENLESLVEIPRLDSLKNLKRLIIKNCPNISIDYLDQSTFDEFVYEVLDVIPAIKEQVISDPAITEIKELDSDLISLEIKGCFELRSIKKLPESLETLNITGGKLLELPKFGPNITEVYIDSVKYLYKLPSFKNLKNLKKVTVSNCLDLESFPMFDSSTLEELVVENCPKINNSSWKRINKFNS